MRYFGKKSILLTAAVALLALSSSASALTLTGGPVYSLPGGGSCSVANIPSRSTGATVSCTGVALGSHTNVYFGVKNNTTLNGLATDGSGPSGGEVFNFSGNTATSITYTSTSSISSLCADGSCAFGADTVNNTLLISTASPVTVVSSGINPASNGNGDIERLFRLNSGTSFTFEVDMTSTDPHFSGQTCTTLYDPTHAAAGGGGCLSRLDLAFYYSDCGDAQIDSPEACDQGSGVNGTAGSCCSATCTFKINGTACTDEGNQCTNDQCNGASATCQHPNKTNGTSCSGNGAGDCSAADTCQSGACANNDLSSGTPCTDTSPPGSNNANQCKDAQCNGSNSCVQTFANETNGTGCQEGNFCTSGDTCQTGTCNAGGVDPCPGPDGDGNCSETCVDTGFEVGNCAGADPNGSACTDSLFCTGTDTCSGGGCTAHTGDPCSGPDGDTNCSESCDEGADNCLAPDLDGTLCRAGSGDSCDPDETCSGGNCPADTITNSGTLCRAGSGDSCDVDETCTGVATQACPGDDAPGNVGVICRDSTAGDMCDLDETCTGTPTDACPADDAPGNAGVECRVDAGDCDVAEQCTGNPDESCPVDGFESAGTGCTDDGETCTTDLCDGNNSCEHDPGNSGTVCRADAGSCDVQEVCNGILGTCPADALEPNGTSCTDGDFCDGAETCQSGTCTDNADPCPLLCDEINDACTVACGDEPVAGCRTSGKAILLLKDEADNTKDKLIFKFIKGQNTDQAEFGTPTSTTDVALCIYGTVGGTSAALLDPLVQGGGANWGTIGTKGYKYKDSLGSVDGIQKVILKGSDGGKTKILIKGRGNLLPDLDPGTLPFQASNYPIVAQVTNSDTGVCWEASLIQAYTKKNTATQYKAKKQVP